MGVAMATTDLMNRNRNALRLRFSGPLCFALLVSTGQVYAQGLEFHGGIEVGAQNTDNVYLVSSPDELDETIYQVSPYLDLTFQNQRITTSLSYRFDWYDYSDLDTTNEFHQYDGAGHGFQDFVNPERYREEQAKDAWAKIRIFLTQQLG